MPSRTTLWMALASTFLATPLISYGFYLIEKRKQPVSHDREVGR